MEEKKKIDWMELLRYPVVTLCIVLGLFLLKVLIGLDVSQITKITNEGIEFREQQSIATSQVVQQLTEKVSALEEKMGSTNTQTDTQVGSSGKKDNSVPSGITVTGGTVSTGVKSNTAGKTQNQQAEPVKRNFQATEFADESVAQLSYVNTRKNTFLKDKEGYIWLGTYNPDKNCWEESSLIIPSNRISITNGVLKVAAREYKTNNNVVLRELPLHEENIAEEKPIGIIPAGTPVTLSTIEEVGGQYWAKVRVEK